MAVSGIIAWVSGNFCYGMNAAPFARHIPGRNAMFDEIVDGTRRGIPRTFRERGAFERREIAFEVIRPVA